MKKDNNIEKFIVDDYTVCSNGNEHTISFKTSNGKLEVVKVEIKIIKEFEEQKKKYKSQKNKYERHIEQSELTEITLNKRAVHKVNNIEDVASENDNVIRIIKEIWKLPSPQNKRVYMKVVNKFSITEIAKIENKYPSVIKRSIDSGLIKLQKKLKNF